VGLRVAGFDEDVRAAASSGVRTVGSLQRLAQECELALVALDGDQAATVIEQIIEQPGSLESIALCGALDPRRVQELATAAKGIALLDAPLDGGEETIEMGRAVIFAGGASTSVDSCRGVLEPLGAVIRVGDVGAGQIARTANDLLRCASVLAIHDAFNLVRAAGGDPSAVREAVLRASGSNRALEEWGRATVSAAQQDIEAALLLARETGASIPFVERLQELIAEIDSEQLSGLFNLGIVDLSKPQDPLAEGEEFEPELS
ncbi:MAG TPA: NAD(P)-binding domain-containing protein, partial [Chloroflexota bacterium]